MSAAPASEPTLDELLRKNPVASCLLAYLGRAKSLYLAGEPWELASGPVPALADDESRLRQALIDDLEITDEAVRLRAENAAALGAENTQLRAAVEQARARTHDAVSECQRRYAGYQSRCDRFDAWVDWCRNSIGERDWHCTSEAMRNIYLGLCESVEQARRIACALEQENAEQGRVIDAANEAFLAATGRVWWSGDPS